MDEMDGSDTTEPLENRRRVLQIVPSLGYGGVERGTLDICRYLIDQNWQPLVASNGGAMEQDLSAIGVKVLALPVHSKNPMTMRRNVRRLQDVIKENRIALVHARSRAPAWSAYYAARRAGVPFLTTFHSLYSGSNNVLKRSYNRVMVRGDRVIAISDHVAAHIIDHYRLPPDRLRVIPRGVDMDMFDPAKVTQDRVGDLKRRWGLPSDKTVIMLPARITWRKGHIWLLRSLHELFRRHSRDNVICVMVGGRGDSGGYAEQVERIRSNLNLTSRVWMVGDCSDMPAAYAMADIVVVPSVGPEAFGRTSIEAQAMGKPVIATDGWGLAETVMPALTGWLVPPNDAPRLADSLELALNMPVATKARLAKRAREFVGLHYTLSRMGKNTLSVYRELIEGRRPMPALLPKTAMGEG